MPTLVSRLAVTNYLLRLQFAFDGINPEVVTIPNSDLIGGGPLSMLFNTPLYNLWAVTGLTSIETADRCYTGPKAEINAIVRDSFPGFAVEVPADVNGAPELVVNFPIKDVPITAIISIGFRHTYDR